jgi:hypothetical protein
MLHDVVSAAREGSTESAQIQPRRQCTNARAACAAFTKSLSDGSKSDPTKSARFAGSRVLPNTG